MDDRSNAEIENVCTGSLVGKMFPLRLRAVAKRFKNLSPSWSPKEALSTAQRILTYRGLCLVYL